MSESLFDMSEFMKKDEPTPEQAVTVQEEAKEDEIPPAPELDVQKAVVESLAADKAEMAAVIASLKAEIATLKARADEESGKTDEVRSELLVVRATVEEKDRTIDALKHELARKDSELAARMEKEFDLQERNPNALALLDREIEVPDRFPGETRDHVLEVIAAARAVAEAEGRVRKAQLLEAVLMANEPNGLLAKRREELEKLFSENNNLVNGPVLEELKNRGISHKNGEDYLLPSEIMKRNYCRQRTATWSRWSPLRELNSEHSIHAVGTIASTF